MVVSSCNPAYSVVLLPEPVGPVPERCRAVCVTAGATARSVAGKPQTLQRQAGLVFVQQSQHPRSPQAEGMVETRTSIARPPATAQYVHPAARAFRQCPAAPHLDTRHQQRGQFAPRTQHFSNVPSTRKRITRLFSNVSMWYPKRLL